ncbi:MAG: CoA ester lyase [Acidobacteria bacterium]|nr:CoA ester lyase [Acidobacteriota bacterium]
MRSLLFVPGVSEKMMLKARDTDADALILDLEDAVSPDRKAEARQTVMRMLGDVEFGGKPVFVRVNRFDTGFGEDDAKAISASKAYGAVLPKVEHPEEVAALVSLLTRQQRVIAMIESPRGILNCPAIADASKAMDGLIFGSADFTVLTRGRLTEGEPELLVARSRMLYSARAAGIDAYDAPYFSIPDLEGLRRDSERARNLGYDGRAIIHPSHIAITNEIFAPSEAEIAQARKIVVAMNDALARGLAAVQFEGQLIEPLHARAAQRILDVAKKYQIAETRTE